VQTDRLVHGSKHIGWLLYLMKILGLYAVVNLSLRNAWMAALFYGNSLAETLK